MNLLEDIQSAVIQESTALAPILLKLRLLAARLGSAPLEAWVRHESEGYPKDAELPEYRYLGVSYKASFAGPWNSGYQNVPIPGHLIDKFAGKHWVRYEMRDGVSAIDELLRRDEGVLEIDAANLILLLQGKVYEGYNCYAVSGRISRAELVEIQHSVRTRVLELTINLEKSVPDSRSIALGTMPSIPPIAAEKVTQLTQQVIYGNLTQIASSGPAATINVAVQQGDQSSLVKALTDAGIPKGDAEEFGSLVASEKPDSKEEPFGKKAKAWLGDNLKKAAVGTWKMGISVATDVLKEAALKYYGLK